MVSNNKKGGYYFKRSGGSWFDFFGKKESTPVAGPVTGGPVAEQYVVPVTGGPSSASNTINGGKRKTKRNKKSKRGKTSKSRK